MLDGHKKENSSYDITKTVKTQNRHQEGAILMNIIQEMDKKIITLMIESVETVEKAINLLLLKNVLSDILDLGVSSLVKLIRIF